MRYIDGRWDAGQLSSWSTSLAHRLTRFGRYLAAIVVFVVFVIRELLHLGQVKVREMGEVRAIIVVARVVPFVTVVVHIVREALFVFFLFLRRCLFVVVRVVINFSIPERRRVRLSTRSLLL